MILCPYSPQIVQNPSKLVVGTLASLLRGVDVEFPGSTLVHASAIEATCKVGASCDKEETSSRSSDDGSSLLSSWKEAELGILVEEWEIVSTTRSTHFDLATRSSKMAL